MERAREIDQGDVDDVSAIGDCRRFTRMEEVERQIEMAVRARLQFDDPVSAITLAGAAERVLSDLSPHKKWGDDALSIDLFAQEFSKAGNEKAVRTHLRKPINRMKHAERDPNVELTVDLYALDTLLMMTIREYRNQAGRMTSVMHAFRCWAAATGDDWGFETVLNNELLSDLRLKAKGWSNSEVFAAYLTYFAAKSLIPNPKSLHEQAQP